MHYSVDLETDGYIPNGKVRASDTHQGKFSPSPKDEYNQEEIPLCPSPPNSRPPPERPDSRHLLAFLGCAILLVLPKVMRDRRIRFLLIAGRTGLASSALVILFNINYVAPIVAVLLAVILQGMRHMRTWRFEGRRMGQFLVRVIVVMCILMIPLQVHILAAAPHPGSWDAIGAERVAVETQLQSLPGPQLALVRYRTNHDPLLEWVYNGAEIDRQKVVWARDMGPEKNEELLRYYNNRRGWLFEADAIPPKLLPYADKPPQAQ